MNLRPTLRAAYRSGQSVLRNLQPYKETYIQFSRPNQHTNSVTNVSHSSIVPPHGTRTSRIRPTLPLSNNRRHQRVAPDHARAQYTTNNSTRSRNITRRHLIHLNHTSSVQQRPLRRHTPDLVGVNATRRSNVPLPPVFPTRPVRTRVRHQYNVTVRPSITFVRLTMPSRIVPTRHRAANNVSRYLSCTTQAITVFSLNRTATRLNAQPVTTNQHTHGHINHTANMVITLQTRQRQHQKVPIHNNLILTSNVNDNVNVANDETFFTITTPNLALSVDRQVPHTLHTRCRTKGHRTQVISVPMVAPINRRMPSHAMLRTMTHRSKSIIPQIIRTQRRHVPTPCHQTRMLQNPNLHSRTCLIFTSTQHMRPIRRHSIVQRRTRSLQRLRDSIAPRRQLTTALERIATRLQCRINMRHNRTTTFNFKLKATTARVRHLVTTSIRLTYTRRLRMDVSRLRQRHRKLQFNSIRHIIALPLRRAMPAINILKGLTRVTRLTHTRHRMLISRDQSQQRRLSTRPHTMFIRHSSINKLRQTNTTPDLARVIRRRHILSM